MSQTIHATRRQKEKGVENLRKRKAEIEVKRKHEDSSSVSNQGSSPKAYSTDTCREEARRSGHLEIMNTSKGLCDISRYPPPTVHSKKTRVDPGPKSRGNFGVTNSVSGPEYHAGMGGLFKNKPKKNARRFTIPGMKSSIAFYGDNISNEHQGVNDEWTKEEDEALIAAASACNNNMFFVADLLSSQATVRFGARRYRPIRHCLDRLLNVLGKDVKNGPLLPKSNTSESDTRRRYQQAFQTALAVSRAKPVVPVGTGQTSAEMHSSHQKLLSEAASKMKGLVRPDILPPIAEILDLFEVPDHHKAGLKSHETARQGQSKRKPFMFAPRDDPRRGNGFTSTMNGSNQDQTSSVLKGGEQQSKSVGQALVQKAANKGARTQSTGSSHRPNVQNRTSAPARNSSTLKCKTVDLKNRNQVGFHRVQQAGNLPPAYGAPSRKVSSSSGGIVPVRHQAQHGTSPQNTSQKDTLIQTGTSGQLVSVKQGAANTSFHSGTKYANVGTSSNVGKVVSGGGQVSNGPLGKSSAAIVQSMGSSIVQKGDSRLYPIGPHAVLSSYVPKVITYGGDRRDRPKMVHTYMPSSMALTREAGPSGNSGRGGAAAARAGGCSPKVYCAIGTWWGMRCGSRKWRSMQHIVLSSTNNINIELVRKG
ncbi:hypothetical protein FGB62_57g17 [Gracilaria domingensis]|nr:hypothetical protein FGB62_57g17 [Gracilaria domingensis]